MTTTIRAEYVLAAAPHISNEETRYYLRGLYVEPHPSGGVFIVATDGHSMFVGHDEAGTVDEPAIYPVDKDLLWACKTKNGEERRVSLDGKTAQVEVAYPPSEVATVVAIIICAPIDGTFPEWQRIVPKDAPSGVQTDGDGQHLTTFMPHVVTKIMATNKVLRSASFRIEADGSSPAIVRFAGRDDLFVVTMPCAWAHELTGLPAFMDFKRSLGPKEL